MIRFDVHGLPAPQGSKRAFVRNGKPILTESSRAIAGWRRLIADVAQAHVPSQPLDGAVQVTLFFRLPVPKSAPKRRRLDAVKRPDLDKLARGCLDALTGLMWRDDSQVTDLILHKELAYDAPAGVTIWIEEPFLETARLPERGVRA